MIGLTTGRQTSQRLNSVLKELAHMIPKARVIRCGKSSLDGLGRLLSEEGLDYAIILHGWHGGRGRIDFFRVEAKGPTPLSPSALLGAVKLRREYVHRGNHAAQAITCHARISETTRRFVQHLSMVLDLVESTPPISEITSTFHVSEIANGSILLGLTSHPAQQEVGPRLLVTTLIRDLHD